MAENGRVKRGYADRIRVDQDPQVERVHAELQGTTPLMEFANSGAMTFDF